MEKKKKIKLLACFLIFNQIMKIRVWFLWCFCATGFYLYQFGSLEYLHLSWKLIDIFKIIFLTESISI